MILDLPDKSFKRGITNVFRELKENKSKVLKENMLLMNQHMENIHSEMESTKIIQWKI